MNYNLEDMYNSIRNSINTITEHKVLDSSKDDYEVTGDAFSTSIKFFRSDLVSVFSNALDTADTESVILNEPFYKVCVSAPHKSHTKNGELFTIEAKTYSQTIIDDAGYAYGAYPQPIVILVTGDGNILTMNKNGKYYPATIKAIFAKKNPLLINILFYAAKNLNLNFFAEILNDFEASRYKNATITLQDVICFHNKKEYVTAKYKRLSKLDINFNKHNINMLYALEKIIPSVNKNSYKYLRELDDSFITTKNEDLTNPYYYYSQRVFSLKADFFEFYFYNKFNIPSDRAFANIIEDYVYMSLRNGKKINLGLSKKKLVEEHDKLAEKALKKRTIVKIKKNSKFNNLRKILPRKYEWIKTADRLISEGEMQHNCVASYSDMITEDECAIYSFVDKQTKNRHTIEFRKNKKGEYRIAQIFKAYNKPSDKQIIEEINNYLKKAN